MRLEWLREIWSYRELLFFLVLRDLKIRYKQTVLGIAWAVIQPLVATVIFFFVFGKFAGIPSDQLPYPVFAYSGLAVWTYFSGAVSYGSNSLIGNSGLLTKVYFPRLAIPAAAVMSGLLDFGIASLVLVAVMAYYGLTPSWLLVFWVLLAVPMVMLALGVSMLLSALNVRFRDVKYVVPFALQIWLFVTPIIYPVSMVPERYRLLLAMNPMTGFVEAFRALAIGGKPIDWALLSASLGLTVAVFVAGLTYFRRAERSFADVI